MDKQVELDEVILFKKPYWCIKTATAQFWYDPQGGGFAKLVDNDGLDWISYVEGPPPLSYRGIPNIQTYKAGIFEGIFHPGYTTSKSSYLFHDGGNLSVECVSLAKKGWACKWDFYPTYAQCSVLSGEDTGFAFLYEGTPGGGPFDGSRDYMLLPQGECWYFTNTAEKKRFISATQAPTRVAFGREGISRLLIFDYEGEKTGIGHYSVFNALTVFGFGRECEPAISKYPAVFKIGFIPEGENWKSHQF